VHTIKVKSSPTSFQPAHGRRPEEGRRPGGGSRSAGGGARL